MSGPVITILDIETAPLEVWAWGLWEQNIGLNMIGSDWTVLSYCAKTYLKKDTVYNDTSKQADHRDDRALMQELWDIIDRSDFIVAHNGKRFDLKKIYTRFILLGFPPPSKVRVIDTLQTSKSEFAFTSNKLEFLTGNLCTKKKRSHSKFAGFELWKQCLASNPKAWGEMKKYNTMDVLSLEELYTKFRPWMTNHPNVAVFSDDLSKPTCKCCGSHKVSKRGVTHTQTGVYQRYKCNSCGTWSRGSELLNTKADRQNILR